MTLRSPAMRPVLAVLAWLLVVTAEAGPPPVDHPAPEAAAGDSASVVYAAAFGVADDRLCTGGRSEGARDQTSVLRRAVEVAANRTLVLPAGAAICLGRADSTIRIAAPTNIDMNRATIRWNAPEGSRIAPAVDILPSADGFMLFGNGTIDGQVPSRHYLDSRYFGTGPYQGGGDALVAIEASGTVRDVTAMNSFDSCIQVAAFDGHGQIVPGHPFFGSMQNIRTINCGSGDHGSGPGEAGPGKGGAGVNNGSGGFWRFDGLYDASSYQGFGCDVGANAGCSLSNFIGYKTRFDAAHPTGPTGNCLYNGSTSSTFTNIQCLEPELRGISSDGAAVFAAFSNVYVSSPARECVQVRGNSTWFGVNCLNPASARSLGASAVDVANSGAAPISVTMFGLDIVSTGPQQPLFGIMIAGPRRVDATIEIGAMKGIRNETAATRDAGPNIVIRAHSRDSISFNR